MHIILGLIGFSILGVSFSILLITIGEKIVRTREKKKDDVWSGMIGFGIFSVIVLIVWTLGALYLPKFYGDPKGVGEAGDMFGGVTALFSGLAFAGLISTLLMQRKELELQRGELELTREEFKLQRFENTLFGLLKMFNDHVTALEMPASDLSLQSAARGREVLQRYAKMLPDEWYQDEVERNDFGEPVMGSRKRENIDQPSEYAALYEERLERDMGPYFRLLYNIVRTIENQDFTDAEKLKYSKIARAYLSSSEVKLLMFNCQSRLGEGFSKWVIKHRLLKHLHPDDAKANPTLIRMYPSIAFDGRFSNLPDE